MAIDMHLPSFGDRKQENVRYHCINVRKGRDRFPRNSVSRVRRRLVRVQGVDQAATVTEMGPSWPKPERPVWGVQRQQADVRSWGLPTAAVDHKRRQRDRSGYSRDRP
jgi:hypothetical protein